MCNDHEHSHESGKLWVWVSKHHDVLFFPETQKQRGIDNCVTTMLFLIPKNVTSDTLIPWWEWLRAPLVQDWKSREKILWDAATILPDFLHDVHGLLPSHQKPSPSVSAVALIQFFFWPKLPLAFIHVQGNCKFFY